MRVRLKGLNRVTKRLANGSLVTYWYAWKSGPKLPGKPGDPEFLQAYHAALATKVKQPGATLLSVLCAYQESSNFTDLAEKTRRDYVRFIRKIESEFGDLPIAALSDRQIRGDFMAWRDRLATQSKRQADYALTVLALILAWGLNLGKVPCNPCERPGRKVYKADRNDKIWTADHEAAFLAKAPEHIRLAFMLALWTGQRQGDLLRLRWSAYDGRAIRLKQSKTGVRVEIPVGAPLKAILDGTKKTTTTTTMLATSHKTTWTESGFRASWHNACTAAGISGLTFHDLRGTAVTRLSVAGCTNAEVATITGRKLQQVASILYSHYFSRDSALGVSAITKLEKYDAGTKIPN